MCQKVLVVRIRSLPSCSHSSLGQVLSVDYVFLSSTQSMPLFLFLRFGFPYNPLYTKKGNLFIPRLLLGLVILFCVILIHGCCMVLVCITIAGIQRPPLSLYICIYIYTYNNNTDMCNIDGNLSCRIPLQRERCLYASNLGSLAPDGLGSGVTV